MKRRSRLLLVFFTAALMVAGYFGWKLFGPTLKAPQGKYFYINTGSNFQDVKSDLVKYDVLKDAGIFERLAKYLRYDRSVKPGKYKVTDGMSMFSLVRMLRSGNQSPVNLVITKLRTKEEFAKKIGDSFEADSAAVINFITNTDTLAKYDLDSNTFLTAIIPNTYTFTWNNTIQRIFRKLAAEQQKFWNVKRRDAAAALGLSQKQAYILASIVEEETNKDEDKGKIASVYLNRMHSGMKLAADPTVKFALKDFGLKRIYYKHLSVASPYNTYINLGLPPGPICTPSIKTIDATLDAPATNYLFFVARPDFSGYSNFASGYEEHKRYASAYQQALDSIILLKQGGNQH